MEPNRRKPGRPRLGEEVMETRSIVLPPSDWALLDQVAEKRQTNRSEAIRWLLARLR